MNSKPAGKGVLGKSFNTLVCCPSHIRRRAAQRWRLPSASKSPKFVLLRLQQNPKKTAKNVGIIKRYLALHQNKTYFPVLNKCNASCQLKTWQTYPLMYLIGSFSVIATELKVEHGTNICIWYYRPDLTPPIWTYHENLFPDLKSKMPSWKYDLSHFYLPCQSWSSANYSTKSYSDFPQTNHQHILRHHRVHRRP